VYQKVLDPADTIFAANFLLGYFRVASDAAHLMRLQKITDLKRQNLWNYKPKFKREARINPKEPYFGINLHSCGAAVESRGTKPEYLKLLDQTSSHINAGGWGCIDFVATLTTKHTSVRLLENQPPASEFVLGFIRLDAGVLNNAPLTRFLGVSKLTGKLINTHLLSAKVIVPTQPFGSLFRGGKLLALLATSNELKHYYEQRFDRQIAVFYTTSLYGTSKSTSQYDQLDRFLQFIGETDAAFPLRIKEPHRRQLIDWMDERGISRYEFIFTGSSKADRSHNAIVKFVRYCLWKHQKDKTIRTLLKMFDEEMSEWKMSKTERKRTYVSTYGNPNWKAILEAKNNLDTPANPDFNCDQLFSYWKEKVFVQHGWGLRKFLKYQTDPFDLRYILLNEHLLLPGYCQIR
jgi:hypothetical protein